MIYNLAVLTKLVEYEVNVTDTNWAHSNTYNAVSINEGLFVNPIRSVGTPETSTPSIFASSLVLNSV